MNDFFISIIVITFNRAELLSELLKSISMQNYSNYEIILVDNNSSDETSEIIQKFSNIRYFKLDQNLGVSTARNYGIQKSSGDIIVMIDDDAEFLESDALKKINDIFKLNQKVGAIAFKILNYYSRNLSNFGYSPLLKILAKRNVDFVVPNFIGCGHAVRKFIYDKIGGYNEEFFFWGEEGDFCIRLYSQTSYFVVYTTNIIVLHKVSPKSRIKWKEGRFKFMMQNKIKIINEYYNPWRRKFVALVIGIASLFIKAIRYNTLLTWFSLFKNLRFNKNNYVNIDRYIKIRKISFNPIKFYKLKYKLLTYK